LVNDLKIGGVYRHYKGMQYIVHNVVKHSETLESLVFYECLYENPEGRFWVRPLEMFLEEVDVDGKRMRRFTFITDKRPKIGL
jgi:hypothetical protein